MTWPRSLPQLVYAQPVTATYRTLRAAAPLLTSAVWASANQAVYVPLLIPRDFRTSRIAVYHGAAVSGNKDLGIYLPDAEGKPGEALFRLGSTAMAGTSIVVNHSIGPPVYLPRGLVYLAAAFDNTTAQVIRLYAQGTDGENIFTGVFTEAAAFPLPATATPVKTFSAAAIPVLAVEGQ